MTGRRYCSWCKAEQDECVLVGVIERGSGPAYPLYACQGRVRALRLVPFADHPADTNGSPLVAPRTAPPRIPR